MRMETIHPKLKPEHYPLLNSVEYFPPGKKCKSKYAVAVDNSGFYGIRYIKEYIFILAVLVLSISSWLFFDFLLSFWR